MNSKRLYSLAAGLVLASAASLFAANQTDSVTLKTANDSIGSGKQLYSTSCIRCHKLNEPSKYTSQQWPVIVDKMQKKAKITDEQKAIILKYLLSDAKKEE